MNLKLIASIVVAVVTSLAVVVAFAGSEDGEPSGAQEETPTATETSPLATEASPTATGTSPLATATTTPTATASPNGDGPLAKVDVCHVPAGNPDNAHTISVGESALEDHLAHGDAQGACLSSGTPGPPGSGGRAKIEVCHVPPENLDNARTISVSERALERHLAHGDTEGECL